MVLCRYLIFVIVFFPLISHARSEKAGTFRITDPVTLNGTEIKPGLYSAEAVDHPDGALIRILKGGTALAEGPAIVIPALTAVDQPRIDTGTSAGERYLRLRIRSGTNWYYGYLEIRK